MDILQAIVLGIVQGLTEFAPISSSGHLVLVPWVLGWEEPGLAFDTVLHLGTLVAVLGVFWRDIIDLATAWLHSFPFRRSSSPTGHDAKAMMAWAILVGTIPAAAAGYLLESVFERMFSLPLLVGFFLLVTALALISSEMMARRVAKRGHLGLRGGLLVGLAQVLAIAPGISRSGATMSAGLALGLRREDAARFSFLLSVPIILGAGASQVLELMDAGGLELTDLTVIAGFVSAAISGYLCINFLLSFLRRRSFFAFSAYCVVLGLGTITLSLIRG